MYFEEEDVGFLNPDGLREVARRQIYTIASNIDAAFIVPSIPTHTEDGIPIRKLYVSNLPANTTRQDLFGVFAQYGFIKSCWLRPGDKTTDRTGRPAYAFVTFSNPEDAHKALQAPSHEKSIRGRNLRISPADSWHQPAEDSDGRIRWKPPGQRDVNRNQHQQANTENQEENSQEEEIIESTVIDTQNTTEEETDNEQTYDMLDILNRDCLTHILSYVPIRDIIRSERVSKRWHNMVQEYLEGIRLFKTSWWAHMSVPLTTAVLRRVLQRVGEGLLRLHIDHHWSALNDRTAHTVGKFCPQLEEIKVVGMHTKNWNPLIYGCKNLKNLSFVSCNRVNDNSLVNLLKNDSCIESLTVANNTHVTGLFITRSKLSQLSSLSFYHCYNLQGTVLNAAVDSLSKLTTLKLDVCSLAIWKVVPPILNKLPKLEELSLSEYTSIPQDICQPPLGTEDFCKAISNLTELKVLNLNRNFYITNAVLKQVAQSCTKLESLNVSGCNSPRNANYPGISDGGVEAVMCGCGALSQLDVSYLAGLTDAGLASAPRLRHLAALTARGNPALSAEPLARAIHACPALAEVDLCGCDGVSEAVVEAAARALAVRPRRLTLWLAATAAAAALHDGTHSPDAHFKPEMPSHKLLTVNFDDDRSNPHLRPDFIDRVYNSSDGSYDDVFDQDFEDFLGSDDDLFLDDEDIEDYEAQSWLLAKAPSPPLLS